jgi:hypothetical protein
MSLMVTLRPLTPGGKRFAAARVGASTGCGLFRRVMFGRS